MYCTQCGTDNTEDSKYCRECGDRLADQSQEIEFRVDQPSAPVNETLLAEILHDTLKHYERYELDAALAKCREAMSINPNGASGHSLMALIYEKKAEQQMAAGNPAAARDCLRSAINQIERVLDANPGSVADRSKLEELRAKLSDPNGIAPKKVFPLKDRVFAYINNVPPQWSVSIGVFLLLFLALIFILRDSGAKNRTAHAGANPSQPTQVADQPTPTFPQQAAPQQPVQPGQQNPSGWGNPPQTAQPMQQNNPVPSQTDAVNPPPPPVYQQPQASSTVPSMPAVPPEVIPYQPDEPVLPITTPVKPPKTPKPKPSKQPSASVERVKTPAAPRTEFHPSEQARAAFAKEDYDTAARLYEQAIDRGENNAENHQELGMCMYNLNKKSAAVNHFQQALKMYSDRKAKGLDPESAETGIRTCQDYLSLLKD